MMTVAEKRRVSQDADKQVMLLVQSGNKEPFNKLVAEYREKVIRLAARVLNTRKDSGEPEDIAQQAFVTVWEQSGRFNPRQGSFQSWLYRIVVNLAIDRMRRRNWSEVPLSEYGDEGVQDWFLNEKCRINQIWVQQLMNQLEPSSRAVVHMLKIDGMSYAEVSRVMGMEERTVRYKFEQSKQKIREIVARDDT